MKYVSSSLQAALVLGTMLLSSPLAHAGSASQTDNGSSSTSTANSQTDAAKQPASMSKKDCKRTEIHVSSAAKSEGALSEELSASGLNSVQIDSIISSALSQVPGNAKHKRVVIIERDADAKDATTAHAADIDNDADHDVEVVVINKHISDDAAQSSIDIQTSKKGDGRCHLSFSTDSAAKGTTFSVHIDGLNEALQSTNQSLKGESRKLEHLDKMLKKLNVMIGGMDSSLHISIEGVEKSNGNSADLKIFVPKELESLEDLNLENLELNGKVEELNPESNEVESHVYVLKLHDGDVKHNMTLRTEQAGDQELSLQELSLSPNPSNDGHFDLSVKSSIHNPIELNVVSEDGRTILKKRIDSFNGSYIEHVDVSGFGSGVYFIRVMQDGKLATLKVVVEQ